MMADRLMRRRFLQAAGVAAALAVITTGCANPIQTVLEETVRQVAPSTGDSADTDTGTDTGTTAVSTVELPEDFPDFVPLPDADPTKSARFTKDGAVNWMLQYLGAWDSDIVDSLGAKLVALGFTEESNSAITGVMHIALYTRDDVTVTLSLLGDEDDRILQYMVLSQEEES